MSKIIVYIKISDGSKYAGSTIFEAHEVRVVGSNYVCVDGFDYPFDSVTGEYLHPDKNIRLYTLCTQEEEGVARAYCALYSEKMQLIKLLQETLMALPKDPLPTEARSLRTRIFNFLYPNVAVPAESSVSQQETSKSI
jgi:hypothetical protein